jgi:hypothetical protein
LQGDDAAGTIFERLATADNPLGYEKDVISDLSLSNDNVVAAETMDLVEARKECVSKPGRRQVLRKNLLKYLQCQKS